MEEIKAGEYVRYKSGLLRKVSRIIPCYENDKLLKDKYYIEFDERGNIGTYRSEQVKEFMAKHSPNIIDLIEVGDYVNGGKVVEIDAFKDWIDNSEEDTILRQEDIKSIVTKEQFSSVEYRLEV